ncbi:UNVERIFIED_ORG: hypothetical protein ABIC62_005706 [Burkholderia sp. 1595]|uniref:Uncharacterized protein n=1 Tax=Paraburkholderia terricola TaxID=169427 RepID=A0ABU1LZN4_9BURK|nr:hypothetical protein [Paraburkholderia terricola]MDR6412218.1 hypothetical protein [Paraburkholderia terricola]
MEVNTSEIEERRANFEALNRETDTSAVAFRNYWRKEGEPWREAVRLIESTVAGETAVTDDVIQNCRIAVMRLHQIRYVLGQLMLPVGSPAPGVLDAVMDVINRIENDLRVATRNLRIILGWQAAARVELAAQ